MAALSSYTPIATQTLSSTSAGITFSSFSGYTDLVLVSSVKNTSLYLDFWIRFNSDTSSNYSNTVLYGGSARASSATKINLTYSGYADTGSHNVITTHIMNYSNSTTYKSVLSKSSTAAWGVDAVVGTWRNTAAITSIDILPSSSSWASGSTFSLYGIANNTAGAKATGGVISSDSDYFYHSFYATSTFTPTQSLTCDYLVVAGGGSGGPGFQGGGGGAGGYRTSIGGSPIAATVQAYTITVGAGGASQTAGALVKGNNGVDSSFSSITSTGGGGGGTYTTPGGAQNPGADGGSGGGAGLEPGGDPGGAGNTPSTSPSQGNNGGAASGYSAPYSGGGGGGAGSVGTAGGATLGNGGSGTASSITGTSITYAGGGGGGAYSGSTASTASGGGGRGGVASSTVIAAVAGTANTGGGGGGGGDNTGASGASGAGGSGIVIIRYAR